jgi:hypothetical protein
VPSHSKWEQISRKEMKRERKKGEKEYPILNKECRI